MSSDKIARLDVVDGDVRCLTQGLSAFDEPCAIGQYLESSSLTWRTVHTIHSAR